MKRWKRIRALLAVILVAVMLVQMSIVAFAENTAQADPVITEPVVTEPVVEQESMQEAQIIAELTDERQEYEKRFMLSNGSMMAVQYALPVHFLGNDGNWIQYNNRMQETDSILDTEVERASSTEYRVIESDSDVRLSKKAGDKKIVTIAKDGHQISWGFVGVNKVELELTDVEESAEGNDKFLNLKGIVQEGWYRDAFEDADLQYLILPTGVKENIILKSADAPTEFELEYKFKNLTAVQIDSKTIDLQDSEGNVVYTITAPNMQDANGEWSDALSLTITEQNNNKLIIKLNIDEEWITSSDRAFPITVDPTFDTEQDWGVISSATLVEGKPNTAYGNTIGHLYVGKETSSNFDSTRALVKLNNLPELTPGDVVVSANMMLLEYASYPSIQVNAYKVTSEWTPSTATWNNFANSHGEFVVDYDKTVSGVIIKDFEPEDGCNYWNITQMVREWYNGTSPNYGVMLMSPSENNSTLSRVAYYSSNYIGAKGVIPIFRITYLNNRGLESYWTYSQQSLSNGTTGYINDFSGNLVYQVPVMSESGARMPISVSLVYNAYSASKNNINIFWTAQKGNGWRTNWDQYCMMVDALPLESSTIESLKTKGYKHVYIDGDGTMHYFKEKLDENNNGTNIFEDEDGLCMTLTINPSEMRSYKISCKDGSSMLFDVLGALLEVIDSDGNTVTAYRPYSQDVSHIVDGAGRTTSFEYIMIDGESHLSKVTAPSTHTTTFEYDENGNLTDIIYNDGKNVSFEYTTATINSTIYYLIDKAIDIDGSYLEYTYRQTGSEAQKTQVASVQEYSNTGREGNKIDIVYNPDNTTKYTYTCGTDSMWALYEFDNLGRTVCIRNDDGSFSQVGYTSGENDKPNRIARASSGEAYVNNLLLDSSAENDTLGWTATATSNVVDTENYFLGYKSLKVSTETATTRTGYYQNVSVEEDIEYTFSTYVKTDNVTATGTNGAGMYVKFYDASNNEIANSAQRSDGVKGTNGWQRINFTFTTPVGAVRARVFLVLMSATGTAYFDCAQLEDGNTMNDYNMLQNSSFSSATKWSKINLGTTGDGVTEGGKLQITGSATENRSAYQRVQINRQKTSFTFSAIANGNSVPLTDETRAFGVKLKIYYTDGTFTEEIAYFNTATSATQKASATAMIPKEKENHTVDYVLYYLIYNNNANSVTFDDCMLTFDETGTTYAYVGDEVITSSDNAGRNTTYNFNDAHELTSYTDSKNETYSYTYDDQHKHRMTSARIEDLNNLGFTYTYDNYGNVTGVKMGNVSSSGVLDTSALYIESSTGYNVEYTVDEEGNEVVDTQKSGNYVTSVTDQRGNTTTYDVDTVKGLTEKVTDAENNVVNYTYYPGSFLPWTVSSDRISGSTTSTETVTYIYDDYNRLETINRNGFNYGFNYDDFGNTTSITVADRTLVTNVYAPNNGYQTSKTYGNGTVYTYTYDDYGRVISVAVNGTTKFNTVYNKKGQVAYIYDVANNRKLVYTYDISGRVLSLTYTGYATISTNYDEFDRPIGVTYTFAGEEKSLAFEYEKGNLKGTAVLLSGATRTVEYDALSRETSTTVGNAYTREITYVSAGGNRTTTLPESVTYTKNSVPLFSESYQYDDIGNIEFVTNNGVTTTYFYDSLNQLTRAQSSDGTVTKYFYNDGGNINYKVNSDGSKTHYVYDEEWKDLLVSFGGQSITYDEIGNPISYLGNTMSWTGRTLDSITKADGTSISYTYDLDGIRTKKTVNGITTEYFVNGSTILAQKTGNDIIWFIYDVDGEILGFTYNDTAYYYVKNVQGDVVEIVNGIGATVATYTYDPWGKITSTTGTMADINPIRYRGYYYDSETGLYYLNSRYYDPDTCRFVNADGYVTTGQGVLSFNMFAYCLNNPVNYSDSSGCLPTGVLQKIVVDGMADFAQATINHNGVASVYEKTESTDYNCYAYVLGETQWRYVGGSYDAVENFDVNFVAQMVVDDLQSAGYGIRIIEAYDSPIRSNEYRIAMRTGEDDYHFMLQHSNGSWSHKPGICPSRLINGVNPSIVSWDMPTINGNYYLATGKIYENGYYENYYNSGTVYFAVSK